MSVTWPKVSNPPRQTDPHFYEIAENIAIYMDEDQDHFHKFGTNLLPESRRVLAIKKQKKGDTERCRELFNEWLRVTTNPKWEQVIEALQKSEFKGPASCLTEALNSSETPQDETEKPEKQPDIDEKTLREMYDRRNFEDEFIRTSTDIEDLKTQQLHVLIQTVNTIEYFAVMLQLKEDCEVVRYREEGHDDSSYLVGKWGEAGIPVVIIQTHPGKDGHRGSFKQTKKSLEWLPHLKYIFAVGVCGGVKGKVDLGHVVVSTIIQDYSALKIKDGKWIGRSDRWNIAQKTEFHHHLNREANNTKSGMVLSGNVLIADAIVQENLLGANPDAIAFEMEGNGIASACDDMQKREIVCMIVKGVSDLADKNKADNWQPQAALNAAKALCKAMKSYAPIVSPPPAPVSLTDGTGQLSSATANTGIITGIAVDDEVNEDTQKGEVNSKAMLKGNFEPKEYYVYGSLSDNLNALYARLLPKLKSKIKKKRRYIENIQIGLRVADKRKEPYFSIIKSLRSTKSIDDLFVCIADNCEYFTYTILKPVIYASGCKKAIKLMDNYIKKVQNIVITRLDLKAEYKNVQINKNKYEENTKRFTVICKKDALSIGELNFIAEIVEECLKLPPTSVLVERVIHNCFILVCRISLKVQLPPKLCASELKKLSENKIESLIFDDDKMELKIPLDCDTEDEILWTEYMNVTTDAIKETISIKSDYHVDIPEKTNMLMLSEPELEESYNNVGANVEMTPLNISETDCANAQVVTKETGEELELQSPINVEAVNRDLSTPAQETSVLHKQTLVLPSSKEKKSYSYCFETEPVFQYDTYYDFRPSIRSQPCYGFSTSTATSKSSVSSAAA